MVEGMIKTNLTNPEGRDGPRRADCVVRAYACAMGVPYYHSLEFWNKFGFGNKRKFRFWRAAPKAFKSRMVARSGTLSKFIKEHPIGRFFAVINGGRHAIAIVDGIVFDHHDASPRERVKAAWRLS